MKIAIASGKGGTGKTLISTNLFRTVEKEGIDVTLIDCDAEEPNVAEFITGKIISVKPVICHIPVIDTDKCVFCGKCHEYCSYHAIIFLPPVKFIKVIEELCHDCGACIEACTFDAIDQKEKQLGSITTYSCNNNSEIIEGRANIGIYSPVPVIKEAIKSNTGSSLTILDSPPGISCPFISTVHNADFVVLVTEPTPFGLNDLKLSAETLRMLNKPFGVIINRAGLGNRDVYTWLEENNIPLLMEIKFNREIARIYSQGKILVDEIPAFNNLFSELYNTICNLCVK
jgi:MinD superfamily P-loop ATPase